MITAAYNEGITGARTSKTLVIEEDNDKSFRSLTGKMLRETTRAARMLSAVYIPGVIFCGYLAAAIVLGRGGNDGAREPDAAGHPLRLHVLRHRHLRADPETWPGLLAEIHFAAGQHRAGAQACSTRTRT